MKYLAVLLLVTYVVAQDSASLRLDSQELRVGRLEASINKFQNTIEKDAAAIKNAGDTLDWLTDTVIDLRGSKCLKSEVECIDSGKCIDGLKACDNVADCKDGSDESDAVCHEPFTVGDSFKGFLHYSNECHFGGVETDVKITITLLQKLTWFPQRPKVEARVVYKYSEDGSETHGSYNVKGYYNPARGVLNLASSDDPEFPGLVAKFGFTSDGRAEADFKMRYRLESCGVVALKKE